MEFYKKRDFGAMISDTFQFFKENGKNYFKNYFLLNGLLLILLMVIVVFGYRELFSQIFDANTEGQNYFFQQYFQENTIVLVIVCLFVLFLFLAVSVINYSYPVFYLKRLSETGDKNIKADQILGDMKRNGKRMAILFLGLFFVVSPLALILIGISYLLIFIIIGLLVLLFVMPTLMNVVNFLLYDFLHTKKGFFESLSYAVRSQFSYSHQREKSPFWKYWGSTTIMYIIIQVITSIFTTIPLFMIMFSAFTVKEKGGNENPFDSLGIMFFVFYGLAILMSLILSNIIYVNSGLLYYDSRTDLHRDKNLEEIDTIGTHAI
ncbi:DUF4013 domain-containing protein [Frigoriflavimonas asaccharolytica]|uniref:Heme/copper-type cytochrome/quinol oxidase subunit 2 n=1 Tax=Frigoriflavimonas asaccharolytica TaxID=2735899 RepID=A0A8J8K941_9FLAO|nr:DUF4013 domain-containing protein [Frigoriflavimonas asaccharolytica]NRS93483.1 heme/copper-type cytochrome/quinol oxidase subunit 2 [Frigoriflavimonas asaccharolytica]